MRHCWHRASITGLNCGSAIFPCTDRGVGLSESEVAASPDVCSDIAMRRKGLRVQGEGVEKPPGCPVVLGKIAVGHRHQQACGQYPAIEHLEELTLRLSEGQGPAFQIPDVALEHQRA